MDGAAYPSSSPATALAAAGVVLDGDEGVIERGDVSAQFLVAGGEIGIVVTADGEGEGFRTVLEVVLRAADTLDDARVLDPQADMELERTTVEAAVRAFG